MNIIHPINSLGTGFLDLAVPMLIQSSILIVILLVLDFLLKNKIRAILRYCLWMLILIKLVLPTSLASPLSPGYYLKLKIPTIATTETTKVTNPELSVPPKNIGANITNPQPAHTIPSVSRVKTSIPAAKSQSAKTIIQPRQADTSYSKITKEPTNTSISWKGLIFLSWLAGMTTLLLLLLQRIIFVKGLIAQAKKPNKLLSDNLEYCREKIRLRTKVSLKISPNTTSPAVCGLIRPVILIPNNLAPSLSSSQLRTVLLHELAHIKRHDLWVNLAQTVLQIIYFYNPLLWLANAIIRRIREQAVDETVQATLGQKARQYPETLLNIAKIAFKQPVLSLRLIGVVESKSALKTRIKRMLTRPIPKSAKLGLLGLIAIVIIGVILLPMAKAKDSVQRIADSEQKATANEKQANFIATLPNGVTVELLGVCEHPNESKQWWAPDGQILDKIPYAELGLLQTWTGENLGWGREFAVRVSSDNHCNFAAKTDSGIDDLWVDRIQPKTADGETIKDLRAFLGVFRGNINSGDVGFGVACGPWEKVEEWGPHDWSENIADVTSFQSDKSVILTWPRDYKNGFVVTVTHGFVNEATRLVLTEKNGRHHRIYGEPLGGTASGMERDRYTFLNFKCEDIEKFDFEKRPYEWVEFKNVSLKPNFKTDVQIEGEKSVTKEESKAQEALNTKAEVFGRVTKEGAPRSNARIITRVYSNNSQSESDSPLISRETRSDQKGNYHIDNLPSGDLSVSVMSAVGNLNVAQKNLKLMPAQKLELNFGDEPGYLVTGTITLDDEPVELAGIDMTPETPEDNSFTKWGWTDKEGHFRITGLPNGTYRAFIHYDTGLDPETFLWSEGESFGDFRKINIDGDLTLDVSFSSNKAYPNYMTVQVEGDKQLIQKQANNPNVSIWLSDSYTKLSSKTETILKDKAEAFEKISWEQLDGAPKEVQEIADVLRRWYKSCLSGDLEEFKALYTPNAQRNAEEQLKELQRYAISAPDWQFSPMVIRIGDSRADAISHDFVITSYVPEYSGDPVVIIVQLMKVDGQWGILGWSGDSLRSISHAHFQRKYPQSRIWFDKSIPDWLKPNQEINTDITIGDIKSGLPETKTKQTLVEKLRELNNDKAVFESYFPDSLEGGKALDDWWKVKDKEQRSDKEILNIIRNGLRRDSQGKERRYRNQYIKWVGLRYIWGKKPQNEKAIELMYYATFDPQLASDAVYHGLSVVVGKKNDKILKRFVELCMANVNVNRILWGTKGQHEDMLQHLEPYLTSSDLEIKNRASVLEKVFKGEINYTKWETEQRRQKRQAEFGEKLPEIREVLLRGNSHQRRELFDLIGRNGLHILFDESFAEPLRACLKDGAPSVREAAIEYGGDLFGKRGECSDEMLEVMNNLSKDWDHKVRKAAAVFIGGHWIWGVEPQNPKAIEIMMELSKDRDLGVRNQAVYYGLSVVKNKDEKIVKRLIEMALDETRSNDFGRIVWGLRGADTETIKKYLIPHLMQKTQKTEPAQKLYQEIFQTEPPELEQKQADMVESSASNTLQMLIDTAKAGDTVIVPEGLYTQPIEINKSLTLKGELRSGCVFEVTADKPAIFIDTKGKGKVTIEDLTIKWQLATSDRHEHPYAVGVKDSKAEIKSCAFYPLGNFQRSPVAVRANGFSELTIDRCRFEGFEYVICYGEGTKGTTRNCLIMNCGHQGIINYSGSTMRVERNVITGSKYHAVRSTGGTIYVKDNLLINNANRGIYLGNKSASGTITNNIIMGNGTGISGFARSKVNIENNLCLENSFAGIDMRDSCSFLVQNNILNGNARGLALFKETGKNSNEIGENTFWQNKVDTENFNKTDDSIAADPGFADPNNSDFSLKSGPVKQQNQGLTDTQIFKTLWKIFENRDDKNVPSCYSQ